MRRLLFIVIAAMGMFKGYSQALVQTYTDRCTGEVKVFSVPMNGATTIAFYNKSRTFTAAQFLNGELQAWLEETYNWYRTLSPCSTNNATSQTTQQTTSQATTNATNAASNATSGELKIQEQLILIQMEQQDQLQQEVIQQEETHRMGLLDRLRLVINRVRIAILQVQIILQGMEQTAMIIRQEDQKVRREAAQKKTHLEDRLKKVRQKNQTLRKKRK